MRTSMRSAGMPKNQRASITSNPLFMSDAESIVILAPIRHVGCFRASLAVTCCSCSYVYWRNGPPEQVSRSLSTLFMSSPTRHWKMALCSESTGNKSTWYCSTNFKISSPATTSVSLLARQIFLRALIALMVGTKPEKPTIEASTASMGWASTISFKASVPAYTLMSGRSARSETNLS